MDSIKDGIFILSVSIGISFLLKYALKIYPPSTKFDAPDTLKMFVGIPLGCLEKDYAKNVTKID